MAVEQRTGRILVVEDEEDLAALVRVNLEMAGHEAVLAYDGSQGLRKAEQDPPDLVLLDIMMPVLDGWAVLRALKENERTSDIPVIMLTALSEERDVIRGHLQGAVRYVTKPFDMTALLDSVQEALQPPDDEELEHRRQRVRQLLQRLAELETGRVGAASVRFSRLETPPARTPRAPEPSEGEIARLHTLTEKQRWIAEQLASGRGARDVAHELEVSRSNIYATRKRIARKLGVRPDDVADESRRLGLGRARS